MYFKKNKGSFEKFCIPLITLVTFFIIMMVFIKGSSDGEKRDEIDAIARNYILDMEATGYLTSSSESELIRDLQRLGVKNINLSGTSKNKVGYGNRVFLYINGDLEINSYSMYDLFNVHEGKKVIPIRVVKKSTGKH